MKEKKRESIHKSNSLHTIGSSLHGCRQSHMAREVL